MKKKIKMKIEMTKIKAKALKISPELCSIEYEEPIVEVHPNVAKETERKARKNRGKKKNRRK